MSVASNGLGTFAEQLASGQDALGSRRVRPAHQKGGAWDAPYGTIAGTPLHHGGNGPERQYSRWRQIVETINGHLTLPPLKARGTLFEKGLTAFLKVFCLV